MVGLAGLSRRLRPKADLALDLGTANTLVYVAGRGIVFNEPSLCSFAEASTKAKFLAAGTEARAMLGRTPDMIRVMQPLKHGVVTDIPAGRELIRYAMHRAARAHGLFKPRVLIGIPADATAAEREALNATTRDAGAGVAMLVDEPLAAAIGAGLPVAEPIGSMIIDCGSSTTEIAVITLGGIRVSRSVRMGGETLDAALIDHLHRRHRFAIGAATAEQLKLEIASMGSVSDADPDRTVEVSGRDLTRGVPRRLRLPVVELIAVVNRSVAPIVAAVRSALAVTPPELSLDIFERGIVLSGGAAMTAVLSTNIAKDTGLETRLAERPLDCVALGLGKMLG